jgi:hypothetical protein
MHEGHFSNTWLKTMGYTNNYTLVIEVILRFLLMCSFHVFFHFVIFYFFQKTNINLYFALVNLGFTQV